MDVAGKKAVIFGGTSGIGLAAAKRLVALGAEENAISRNPDKAGDVPAGITLKKCDVLDRDAVQALLKECAPYDILVSAATGGARAIGPLLEMDMDGFKASFDKLWGYANVVRFGAEHLSDDGTIVLVSGAPARKARPGQAAIASGGGAVEALVRSIASELAPKRINIVSPGVIDTPMFGPESEQRSSMVADATSAHPIPRAGRPEEVAKGIMFVVENDFTTGTTVDVDGGWLISCPQ